MAEWRVTVDRGKRKIVVHNYVDGVLADATSVVLRDSSSTWGIRRTDTGATVVPAGTAVPRKSTGVYEYVFRPPELGIKYEAAVEVTQTSGEVDRQTFYIDVPSVRLPTDAYITEQDIYDVVPWAQSMLLTSYGQQDLSKILLAARRWLDEQILARSGESYAAVEEYLERGGLLVDPAVRRASVYYALSLICQAQITEAGDRFDTLAEQFLRQAKEAVRNLTARIDTNHDGYADLVVSCRSSRITRA